MPSVLLLASLVALSSPVQQTGPGIRDSVKNLFTIRKGYQSSIKQLGLRPIYTQTQFQAYWAQSTGQPANTAPVGIDWIKQMVLAVHLGQRNTGGYDVDVMRIDTSNGVASVLVRERKPLQGEIVTQAITSPWAIVRFDRTTLPFRMEFTQSQNNQIILPNGGSVIRQGGLTITTGNPVVWATYGDGWAEYDRGIWCETAETNQFIISSQTEFTEYFVSIRGKRADQVPMNVNWGTEKLVAIHIGDRPHPGYRIQVEKIEVVGNQGIIHAVEVIDTNFAGVRGRNARPYVMVKVSRSVPAWKVDLRKE